MMTPIETEDDLRLVTLIGVVIDLIGEQSLMLNHSPETLLAESLYRVNKNVNVMGTERYINQLCTCYPLLREAII
jgi:hypothetical protein